jgi:hypothetical protein
MELTDLAEQRVDAAERNSPREEVTVAPAVCKVLLERPIYFGFAERDNGLFGLHLS